MNANLAAVLYLVSGILFVLALRGLSHPTTSRQGNLFGMVGMGIAVLTTLALSPPHDILGWVLVIAGIGIGGGIGAVVARRIAMTAMPQLVAAFHSLVGLAAVLVAAAALYAPAAFGIGEPGNIHAASLIEMTLGVAIGVEGQPQVTLAPGIHHGVAGTAIKAEHIIRRRRAQYRQVRHATDIEHGPGLASFAKHCLVKGGYQGCTLATRGKVAAPEVRYHIDAGQFSEQGRIGELQCVTRGVVLLGLMANGLPVGANRLDLFRCLGRTGQQLLDYVGIETH